MPRILKRPMFRSGGSTNEGIMHGLVDRKGYAEGPTKQEIYGKEFYDIVSKIKPPKPRFDMGEMGLNLVSGKYAGDGFLSNVAGSARGPYTAFTKADDTSRNLDYQTQMAAAKYGMSKADAEKLALAKAAGKTTTKAGYNTVTGKTGFFTPQDILNSKGTIIPVPQGQVMTLNTNTGVMEMMPACLYDQDLKSKDKAQKLGTQYQILEGFIGDMKARLPTTKTGALGYGFEVVEGFADQIAQVAESFGVKENWKEDDYDERAVDNYLAKKGFTASLEEGAAGSEIMKGAVINLAYALARIAEPGNPKLSEGDIIRQLNRIKYGGSRNTFAKSLAELLEQEKIRATETIKGFNLKPEDYLGISEKDETDTIGTSGVRGMKKDYNPLGYPEELLAK